MNASKSNDTINLWFVCSLDINYCHETTKTIEIKENNKKWNIPFTPERTFLTLRSHPSQSILTLSATVWICFFFLRFLARLNKADKYSKVPSTPIFFLVLQISSFRMIFVLREVSARLFVLIKSRWAGSAKA